MRARFSAGFFILGVLLLTMDPIAGQPGGGKGGKWDRQPGGFGQPTVTPGGFGQPGTQPGGFGQPGAQPGGFGQPGGQPGGVRFQFQPNGGQPGGFGQPGGYQMQPGGQPGGFGQQGGGFGRGGMDPERMFSFMSKGQDSIDLNQMTPEQRQGLRAAFDRMGVQGLPESGTLTKGQFVAAVQQAQAARAAQGGQPGFGQPGGQPGFAQPGYGQPGFGQPGFGQPNGFQPQPGQFGGPGNFGGNKGGMTDEDLQRRFSFGDKDQDGRLSFEEASDRTKAAWNEYDTNRDGFVSFDEYKTYQLRLAAGGGFGQQPFGQQPQFGQPQFGNDFRGTGEGGGFGGPGGFGRREEKKDDFSNVGIRYGKLPPGLPDWFAECDTDKDGQINMYEWRTVKGESVAAFRELDVNDDGFLAPLELIRVTAVKAETDRLLAIQDGEIPQGSGQGRGKGGSMSGGKGGFPGFGGTGGGPPTMGKGGGSGGGPPTMGKGGGSSSETRPSREEKRDEKADRSKAGPWGNGGKK